MLESLQKELQALFPDFVVEYDENKMQNYKAINQRDKTVLYIEEYRTGSYGDVSYQFSRTDSISLYIYNSGKGNPLNAEEREIERTALETNVVKPLCEYFGDRISGIRYNVSTSRYNSLETGLSLTFSLVTEICY